MARNLSHADPFPLASLDPGVFPEGAAREEVRKFNTQLRDWHTRLNGSISLGVAFDENAGHLDAELITFTNPVSAADFPVAHNLGRLPVGVIPLVSETANPIQRLATTPAHSETLLWFQTAAVVGVRYWILVF